MKERREKLHSVCIDNYATLVPKKAGRLRSWKAKKLIGYRYELKYQMINDKG